LGANHLHSHIYAGCLADDSITLPFVALIVSGGHTSLYYVKDFDKMELLGSTQDDACGEAFDKVAKILGLGYPGGPHIERCASHGDPRKVHFGCSKTSNPLDFSFSGIKTAVLYYVWRHASGGGQRKRGPLAVSRYPRPFVNDICASFQETVFGVLIQKSLLACKLKKSRGLVIGGGVAANSRLRDKFLLSAKEAGVAAYFPSKTLCMDNAAMVAGIGFHLYKRGKISDFYLGAG
jgi:N6-L-threonylcarbamoyladenine synthase